jgi:N-acetylglucosaminyl-diphospho-decaprenol L-rhamnosyltransferase
VIRWRSIGPRRRFRRHTELAYGVVSSRQSRPVTDCAYDTTLVSVIIVTHNSADVITTALSAVATNLPDAEIIVVDNGSTDPTCHLVASYPHVRVIHGHGNPGFGAGVNRGAQAARGRLLLVLNPDAFVTSVDHAALSALAGRSPFGLLGCQRWINGRNQRAIQVRWGWRRELCWSILRWYLVPRELELLRPRPRRNASTWISGAAFIVNREEFLHVGGFDERLFLYYEDFELSRTYSSRGLPLALTDSVILDHLGGASSPRDEDLMVSFALLSLIEQTAKWHGVSMSHSAARWVTWLLRAIEIVGRSVRATPWVGERAHRKASSAASVRGHLRRAAGEGPTGSHYPLARPALRSQLERKGN